MMKTATLARAAATLPRDLDAPGQTDRTARQSAPDAPQAPFCCVTRWTGRGWRAASRPLPQRDAVTVRLKAGGHPL